MTYEIKKNLSNALKNNDLQALSILDAQGFIIGPKEEIQDYYKRIKAIISINEEMTETLKNKKTYDIESEVGRGDTLNFPAKDEIKEDIFKEAEQITSDLYDFKIDWVKGFYQDCGFFFGGCTYFFEEKNLTLFIINKGFKQKEKWLIYSRKELLSHEICHVARTAFLSELNNEEHFAYQTSESSFRRKWGGFIHDGSDFKYLIISFVIMFAAQLIRTLCFPKNLVPWELIFIITIFAFYIIRHINNKNILAKCYSALSSIKCKNVQAVCFRLSDEEIIAISKNIKEFSKEKLSEIINNDIRFEIIYHRFW